METNGLRVQVVQKKLVPELGFKGIASYHQTTWQRGA